MSENIMLIVDAFEVNRRLLQECFEADYIIIHACDGEEAIEKIEEYSSRISIILLGIAMPDLNGIEVLKWMADKLYNTIPVIAVTEDSCCQAEAIKNGAWDFIADPGDVVVAKARIKNVIGRADFIGQKKMIELQKAQKEMENLVNSIPGGIAIYKLTDHFETVYFSDGVAALSGLTREEYNECMKHPAESFVYEVDLERLYSSAVEALREGRDINITYRIHHKNGGLVWVHLNATVISENDGELLIHAVLQSVSKRDRLCDLLVSETQSAIYVSDVESYELLYLNKTAAAVLNKSAENYTGKKCYAYIFDRSSPCPFCRVNEICFDSFTERSFENPADNRNYQMKGKLVDWCGIKAHVEYILDVTEQYAAQLRLRETQNMLTAALHNTNVTVWEYDIASKTIVQSVNSMEVNGLENVLYNVPESLIENGFIHPESAEDFRELHREVQTGKPKAQKDILVRAANRDGYLWERTTYVPVFEEDGRHLKSIGTSMDVTEQKNLEESYKEIQDLRAKVTNGIMINVTKNTVDAVYSELAGEPEQRDLKENNMTVFFQRAGLRMPDEKQRAAYYEVFNRDNFLHMYAVGRTEHFVEALCRYQGNEYRVLQLNVRLSKNPHTGDVIGYAYIIDVDDQRTVEKLMDKIALENFEFILLLNVLNNKAKMMFKMANTIQRAPKDYHDYDSGIKAFCKLYTVEDQRERRIKQMSIENVVNQLEYKNKYVVNLPVKTRDGEVRLQRLCYSYLSKAAGKVLVTAEDITELTREEREKSIALASALKKAERANQSKTQFLSNMSHDMRTPMNAIIGFSQMALDENASIEELRDSMQKINESGHYLLSLISDILDMAKLENRKMELRLEVIDQKALFDAIIATIKPMMDAKHIDFTFKVRHLVKGKSAITDKLRMQQIFVNLLSNAAKFTHEYGRVECIIETLSFEGKYSKDKAIIRDNGCGMSKEFLERASLPFEQEYAGGEASQSGTGLGLSIVKNLVDLMGGTIEIKSEKGVGTEITMLFQTELVDAAPKTEAEIKAVDDGIFSGKKILLCEDHPMNREIAGRLLTRKNVEVETAADGKEGLDKFRTSPDFYYDAIIMDIRMPIMDGLQAASAIRQLDRRDAKSVPIIAMTANAFDDDVQKSINAGMNAHLSKPIDPAKLYNALSELLSGRKEL